MVGTHMDDNTNITRAIELLQQLGLKEYEAKCFVALTRLNDGTAKEISEISEVPRTRVYDATRVLESKGLVEVQHTSPQMFRAVGIDEAVETLRNEYQSRTETLRETLEGIERVNSEPDRDVTHEVWALSGETAIRNRTAELVEESQDEVVFVAGTADHISGRLTTRLRDASERDVSVLLGGTSEPLVAELEDTFPDAEVFQSGLEWLGSAAGAETDETDIGLLLLVDREIILVSSLGDHAGEDGVEQRAVFGRGFENGLVTIARRLMATGLLPRQDPASE